ncbi:MAG: hypothetical protein IKT63_03095, partial [Oscillospiraceae bacterium]|nr:hypothetical protein [Oscillospiraceae bacterium]
MANNNDVDKILQNIKNRNPQTAQKSAGAVSSDRLSQIIAQETAKAQSAPAPKAAVATAVKTETAKTAAESTAHDIEDEFFSQLATALKENPAVADLVEEVPKNFDEKEDKNKVSVTAASYVDEKFVDFFTQSIAVPKPEPKAKTSEIVVKRKKFGLFKNKYITDSLSLSIPQEEIDRRQQKVAKASTQELARDFIAKAAKEVKPFTDEIPVQKAEMSKAKPEAEPATAKAAKKGDTKEIVVDKPAAKAEFLPESKNDSAILYYEDGKPAPQKAEAPKAAKPMDADSILQSLKSKKTVTAHIVAEKETKAVKAQDTSPYSAEKVAAYYAKNAEEAPLEDTGYIPSVAETAEDREIRVVPKAEEDSTVKAITGDITQLFAKTGLESEKKEKSLDDTDEFFDIPIEDFEDSEEVFEEYTDEDDYIVSQFSDDPAEIFDELKNFKFTLSVRVALSAICSVVLLYLSLGAGVGLPLPQFINPLAQPLMFYLANLVFFAIVLIGFLPTVANGVAGFVGMPAKDSFMVLPSLLCFAQINVAIFTHNTINPESVTLFAGVTALAFGFNALGKYINANTILRNLSLADVPEGINAGYVVKDAEDVKRLARSLEEKNPQILVSRRTGYISNFISGGFSNHASEKHCRLLSIIAAAVAVICGVIGFVMTKDWSKALF